MALVAIKGKNEWSEQVPENHPFCCSGWEPRKLYVLASEKLAEMFVKVMAHGHEIHPSFLKLPGPAIGLVEQATQTIVRRRDSKHNKAAMIFGIWKNFYPIRGSVASKNLLLYDFLDPGSYSSMMLKMLASESQPSLSLLKSMFFGSQTVERKLKSFNYELSDEWKEPLLRIVSKAINLTHLEISGGCCDDELMGKLGKAVNPAMLKCLTVNCSILECPDSLRLTEDGFADFVANLCDSEIVPVLEEIDLADHQSGMVYCWVLKHFVNLKNLRKLHLNDSQLSTSSLLYEFEAMRKERSDFLSQVLQLEVKMEAPECSGNTTVPELSRIFPNLRDVYLSCDSFFNMEFLKDFFRSSLRDKIKRVRFGQFLEKSFISISGILSDTLENLEELEIQSGSSVGHIFQRPWLQNVRIFKCEIEISSRQIDQLLSSAPNLEEMFVYLDHSTTTSDDWMENLIRDHENLRKKMKNFSLRLSPTERYRMRNHGRPDKLHLTHISLNLLFNNCVNLTTIFDLQHWDLEINNLLYILPQNVKIFHKCSKVGCKKQL